MRLAAPYLLGLLILAGGAGLRWAHHAVNGPQPGTATGSQMSGASPSPLAMADKTVRDFGTVSRGEELNAKFTIKNAGTKRLILSDQSQCCGSDAAEVIIPPGETKDLNFSIPTMHRPLGPHRKQIRYETNDRLHPVLAFTLLFNVV